MESPGIKPQSTPTFRCLEREDVVQFMSEKQQLVRGRQRCSIFVLTESDDLMDKTSFKPGLPGAPGWLSRFSI